MIHVCFVCLGNICRSPTAEGVMTHLVEQAGLGHAIRVDSAGTGPWHVGESADRRARAFARQRGYDLTSRGRQFAHSDFARFHYILAMDRSNRRELEVLASTAEERSKVRLFRSFDPNARGEADVPDPYYGGARGFDEVFDMCERTCRRLLEYLRTEYALEPRSRA